jgi:regulatory protein
MARRTASGRRETLQEVRERHARVDDPEVVFNAALRFLEVRNRSVAEVRRRLGGAGYPVELIEAAIKRLLDAGVLDDVEFAQVWVRSRDRARPRGEQALRRELLLKGIDREVVGEVLDERARGSGGEGGDDEPSPDRAAAERLLERRRAYLQHVADPRARRQRAYAMLARNGFSPEICREAAARLFDAPEGLEPD